MEEENKPQQNDKNIKVLRTYTSDMVDVIRTDEESVIKIALAEKEKREREALFKEAEGTKTSKILFVIGGIVLIAIAIVGSYFLFQKKKEKEIPKPIVSGIETFITYNDQSYIDVSEATNVIELLDAIKQQESTNPGLIKALFLTRKINGVSEMLTSKNFLTLIDGTAPGAFTRSLADKYLFGKYSNPTANNEKDRSAMFLIFQTSDYTQTYASMLSWEETILKDLFVLFDINTGESNKEVFERSWKDTIINNKDARVLYGDKGEAILYYVFVNKNNLVITSSAEALKEIISRLIIKNAQTL